MKTGDAVREVMKLKEVGVNQMADRLDKSPRLISERLSQQNISITKLREMLRVLDYKVIITPRNASLPDNSFEID